MTDHNTRIVRRADGRAEIHNPPIDAVQRGMMVRTRSGEGIIVTDVNPLTGEVSIHCSIGGTAERIITVPISEVAIVWSIGTYEQAMARIAEFNGAVAEMLGIKLPTRVVH